jgi:hypothetical protein
VLKVLMVWTFILATRLVVVWERGAVNAEQKVLPVDPNMTCTCVRASKQRCFLLLACLLAPESSGFHYYSFARTTSQLVSGLIGRGRRITRLQWVNPPASYEWQHLSHVLTRARASEPARERTSGGRVPVRIESAGWVSDARRMPSSFTPRRQVGVRQLQ